jgi:signal transduction histidine kinase
MKEFSHPGAEAAQATNLNRAIESTITVARSEWKYVAELQMALDDDLPLVPCDVSAINQVILNIVVNAAQAIGEKLDPGELGHIWIASKRNGDHAEVTIEDDGPGIPESIREKVFDPFFTTKNVGKGTGQGLAIAYRVVNQQHGGVLSVGPGRNNRGAKFKIMLPLDAAQDRPDAAKDSPVARLAAR